MKYNLNKREKHSYIQEQDHWPWRPAWFSVPPEKDRLCREWERISGFVVLFTKRSSTDADFFWLDDNEKLEPGFRKLLLLWVFFVKLRSGGRISCTRLSCKIIKLNWMNCMTAAAVFLFCLVNPWGLGTLMCVKRKKEKNQSIRTRIKQAKTNERRGGKKNKGNNNNTNEARKTKQNIRYSIYVCAKFTSPPGEGPVGFYLETLVKQSVQTHLSLFPGPKLLIWLYATIYCIVKNWFCASQGWKKTTMQHLTWCSLHLKVYGMMVWCHKQPFSTALTHLRETSTAKSWMTPPPPPSLHLVRWFKLRAPLSRRHRS